MRKLFCILVVASILFNSCDGSVKSDKKDSQDSTVKDDNKGKESGSKNKIRNGIDISDKGLKVEQAFLLFENGQLVPEDNKVEIGQQVQMRLILKGWKEENGKAFPGASEKVETSDGDTVLDVADLFSAYTDGVAVADANIVTLSAVITKVDRLFDYFRVSFRVWDKKGDGEVTGSYKLYLK